MSDFDTRYRSLNAAQKQAVDTLDGPVMVVAGPGTGKTELLSMRVANILKNTDSLPPNILCLTYTESGAHAMRERLAGLVGSDAYKVAIHTFHSFGSEVINRNAEYFYHGAYFRPADELSSYEILRSIFEKLPHDNMLASKMNDEFTYLRDVQMTISDLKKSGLTSDELLSILDRNDRFIDWVQPRLDAVFADRLSKKSFSAIERLVEDISSYSEAEYELITYEPLHILTHASLSMALEDATTDDSTKPLSAWKREWCEKREDGSLTLKDAKRSERLRAVAGVYYDYLIAMQKRSLFDFDDMILRTVHALEVFSDLRLNLQEQYQYILVDEFQDTNDAQMRLLWNLTNNPASEGRPNVMIVGDDDQAIYRFQGANLSNILDFRSLYRDVAIVTLKDNYRSAAPILDLARATISHAGERLETVLPEVDKTLTPHHKPLKPELTYRSYIDETSEYSALAEHIQAELQADPDRKVAVIARHHRQLQALLPYLQQQDIPLSYDRRDNVLDTPPVLFLEKLTRAITLLAEQQLEEFNGLLPELLSHPAWGISARDLWKLSLESYQNKQFWLETMLAREDVFSDIAEWLIYSAHLSVHEPLEYVIDHLTGTSETQVADSESEEPEEFASGANHETFRSPLRDYYFSHHTLEQHPTVYIGYLDALSSIRRHIRDYRPEGQLLLRDFMYCIDKYRQLGISIQARGHVTADQNPVELLTAHRSKVLEFDSVYVVSLVDSVWGETARSRSRLIGYPHNLPIGISGDSSDEHVRLLFVALTRAKSSLYLSAHKVHASGKQMLPVAYLSGLDTDDIENTSSPLTAAETSWRSAASTIAPHSMKELLHDTLSTYKLSATHLCNFLDVSRGGPELFLLQNLLRFPQAMSPSAAFGSAIHATLQRAHAHLTATGKKRPVEDLLNDFESALGEHQLASDQYEYFAKKGGDVLSAFLAARYDSFSPSQRVEQNFASDHVVIEGDVRLSGAIDLMDIDDDAKTIQVTDYKTGKSTRSWRGRTDYEKIKLHHYKHQLMFYKLLIENSRQYSGYTVTKGIIEYVEPDSSGTINRIELDYDASELQAFERLLIAVWQRIQALDFSTTTNYDKSFTGILEFEQEVISPRVKLLT
jgi:DNA helicase-2/ATP-dependent DNA helicase PcrA